MTQDEKREYIAIHNIGLEDLSAVDGNDTGKTYARLLWLRKKVHLLSNKEAFALEGSRNWAEFEKEMS